jgi:flagellar biosynthetic protein FliP
MAPTFEEAYKTALSPLMEEKISEEQALNKASEPFKKFMLNNTRSKDLELFSSIAKLDTSKISYFEVPIRVVIPSFMISELRKAFEIGFLLFLPFLVIDILVSSILMAMGMMMMPPVMVSLPFKVIFFVLIDGWYMICGSLVKSYVS